MNKTTDGLTISEDEQVVALLKKWQGGVLSEPLFNQLAWMLPIPTVETVVLRKNNNQTEVLLVPRPETDKTWPGQLHSPGQALRHMDYKRADNTPVNGPFERVQELEIKGKFTATPQFVGVAQYMTKRGPEAVHIYLAAVDTKATIAEDAIWYPVADLEKLDNFITHQLYPIRKATELFENNKLAS